MPPRVERARRFRAFYRCNKNSKSDRLKPALLAGGDKKMARKCGLAGLQISKGLQEQQFHCLF
jgi:hypothetical protein